MKLNPEELRSEAKAIAQSIMAERMIGANRLHFDDAFCRRIEKIALKSLERSIKSLIAKGKDGK